MQLINHLQENGSQGGGSEGMKQSNEVGIFSEPIHDYQIVSFLDESGSYSIKSIVM